VSDKSPDLKVENAAVLQPKGEYENAYDFAMRCRDQKKTSFSIPPRGEHEGAYAFAMRLRDGKDRKDG
jgi:hypothetical protein